MVVLPSPGKNVYTRLSSQWLPVDTSSTSSVLFPVTTLKLYKTSCKTFFHPLPPQSRLTEISIGIKYNWSASTDNGAGCLTSCIRMECDLEREAAFFFFLLPAFCVLEAIYIRVVYMMKDLLFSSFHPSLQLHPSFLSILV